jgi:glycerol-3-phosphate dehydrogenase (NAD(P)+)
VSTDRPRAAVLGTGAWGTTFAAVLADAGCPVTLWGISEDVCAEINTAHRNSTYLPDVDLPTGVRATTDAADALDGARVVAVAIPAQVARSAIAPLAHLFEPDAVAVSLMKGVELSSHRRMSEVIGEALGFGPERIAVISGPNLAREIAVHQPTATVVASSNPEAADLVAHACANSYFRPYTNSDVVGVELSGAVKNVIALAVGMAQGRGYGTNTTATLITRGLVEITRLGLALGADAATFAGLAGMGDLVATCVSPLSRNHTLGWHMGQGKTLEEAIEATGGTAEGVKTSASVLELARSVGVDMPITDAVVQVLHEGLPIDQLPELLLNRPRKAEGVQATSQQG